VNQLQGVDMPLQRYRRLSIAVRGIIYGRERNGSLVAVDAKTGKELWVRENMNDMSSRAASSAGGRGRGGPPAAAPAASGSQPAPLGWVFYAFPAKQP